MHPIIECADDLGAALKGVASVEPAFMSVAEKQAALVALTEVRSQLDAVTARLLTASDDVGEVHGLRDAAAWLAVQTRTTRAEARRVLALGRGCEQHPAVGAALGRVVGCVPSRRGWWWKRSTPSRPASMRRRVSGPRRCSSTWPPSTTRVSCGRSGSGSWTWSPPRWASPTRRRCSRAEEDRALAGVELTLVDDGEGRCHGRFVVPSHVGAMLKRHLLALANPARHAEDELRDESGEWKPLRRRLGEALVEYVERYPVDATPQTAGVNATVVVTMTIEQLLADHATALLDDGSRMSAGQARRLACGAGIIPVVLGSKSVPLDLGRAVRLFTKAQRIALGLRDGGCTARGCETSASGCHAHHDDPWSRGGLTDLANGRLLCPRHHRLAHDSRYAMTIHADNKVTYARRT